MGRSSAPAAPSSRSRAFAPGRRAGARLSGRTRIGLVVVPALLALAHLTFGANQMLAAQVLAMLLAAALIVGLMRPAAAEELAALRPLWPVAALFGVVMGWAILSLFVAGPDGAHPVWGRVGGQAGTINRSATLLEIAKLGGLACVFLLGCMQGARRSGAVFTINAILAVGAVWAGVALTMYLGGLQVADTPRLTGGLMSPNSAATVFGVLTVLAAADMLRRLRGAPAGLPLRVQAMGPALACGLLFAGCLLLTASRMGVASTLLALAALVLWSQYAALRRHPLRLVGGLALALGGLLLLGGDLFLSRLARLGQDTGARETIFSAHWSAFLETPLTGHGLGTFNDVNNAIMTPETFGALHFIRAMHNVYLQWLTEVGVLGAAAMFGLIAVIMAVATARAADPRPGQSLQRGLIAANLVVLAHGLTDYALQTPSIAAFWAFLLGLQFAFGALRD